MSKIVGIDLGTTNSLVAIVENGVPRVLTGRDGNKLVPSIIHFEEGGEVLVGNSAKARLIENPKNTIFSIKRFMGKGIEDVREDLPLVQVLRVAQHPEQPQTAALQAKTGGR